MLQCDELPPRGRKAGYVRIAAETGGEISAHTLEDIYQRWLAEGEIALIDKRLLRKRGKLASVLHENTVQEWLRLCETNQHLEHKSKLTTGSAAWEVLMRRIFAGDKVPGLGKHGKEGTWRELWQRVHPRKPLPARCEDEWSLASVPPGHSLNNFRDRQGDRETENNVAVRGIKELKLAVPQMRMDYSDLEPGAVIQCDDVDLNAQVMATDPDTDVTAIVPVKALVFLDVATRKVLSVSLHLGFKREDGSRCGIERRHVQHGVAHVLATIGVARGREMVFRVENATAAITEELEMMLKRVSDGSIKVSRTPVHKGKVLPDGFTDSWGASNKKGHIESWNRQLAIRMGWAPGQEGANWTTKPHAVAAMLKDSEEALAVLDGVATEDQVRRTVEHDDLEQLIARFEEVVHDMENTPLHHKQGFKEKRQWRLHDQDKWRDETDPMLARLLKEKGVDFVDAILAQDGCTRKVMETVNERWLRLYRAADFEVPHLSTLYFLYLDVAKGKWTARNEVEAQMSRGKAFVFYGTDHRAAQGEKVKVHFDCERPSLGCVLVAAEDGVVLGTMAFRQSGKWGDFEFQAISNQDKAEAEDSVLLAIHRRHDDATKPTRKARRLNVMREVGAALPETAEHPAASGVVDAYQGRRKALPARSERAPEPALPAPDFEELRKRREALHAGTGPARKGFSWTAK
jgi:hypothetical protein